MCVCVCLQQVCTLIRAVVRQAPPPALCLSPEPCYYGKWREVTRADPQGEHTPPVIPPSTHQSNSHPPLHLFSTFVHTYVSLLTALSSITLTLSLSLYSFYTSVC